jgi:hypothetical protein
MRMQEALRPLANMHSESTATAPALFAQSDPHSGETAP